MDKESSLYGQVGWGLLAWSLSSSNWQQEVVGSSLSFLDMSLDNSVPLSKAQLPPLQNRVITTISGGCGEGMKTYL